MPPKCILVFSGKRKSGKDYVTDVLYSRIGSINCALLKLSGPIKKMWATAHNLNFEKLMEASEYKEHHRIEMIKFGEDMRNRDNGYFCRASIEMSNAEEKPVWIVSDARRKTDLKWFKENYGDTVRTVRIKADDDIREQRGWVFTSGVDDAASECDLDSTISWDWVITNNGSGSEVEDKVKEILAWTENCLHS